MKIVGTNISMIKGDTETIKVVVKDKSGALVPLMDGDTVYFTVKTSISVEQITLQKVITEFVDGIALIPIARDDTKNLMVRSYFYDIQLVRSNGDIKTIIPPSQFNLNGGITYD